MIRGSFVVMLVFLVGFAYGGYLFGQKPAEAAQRPVTLNLKAYEQPFVLADYSQGGFFFDSNGNLKVTTAGGVSPSQIRIQDGTTTSLAAVDTNGTLRTAVCQLTTVNCVNVSSGGTFYTLLASPNGAVTVGLTGTGSTASINTATNSSGGTAPIACDSTARMTGASASAVLVTHVAAKTIYVCAYNFNLGLVATTSAILDWGTGTNCGTSTVSASGLLSIGTTVTGTDVDESLGSGVGVIDSSPVAGTSDLCIVITGAAVVNGIVRYAQF